MPVRIGGITVGPRRGVQMGGGGGCAVIDRINGVISLNATFTHPADCVVAFDTTTLSGASQDTRVGFRVVDVNNCWNIRIRNDGNLYLMEMVAGVETPRITVGSVVVAGYRIVAVAIGSTITLYSGVPGNLIQRGTYASASNFATATAGKVTQIAISSSISNLKTYMYACRALEGL